MNRNLEFSRRAFNRSLCGLPFAPLAPGLAGVPGPWDPPAVVAEVYIAGPTPHLPNPSVDVKKEVSEIKQMLQALAHRHSDIRFVGGQVLTRADEIEGWARSITSDVDAVLIVPITSPSVSIETVIDSARRPCLVFQRPHASHHWAAIAAMRTSGRRVDVVASSSANTLDLWVPVFRSIHHLRRSKVIVAAPNRKGFYFSIADDFAKHFGTSIRWITIDDLREIYSLGDMAEAEREAAEFSRNALKIVEPSPKTIRDAMRFYLGLRKALEREGANAVTIDCFPALLAKQLPAYPCLAWSKLNDAGLYGVCQGDVRSTMTQLMVTSYAGVPGFVSNPVFDLDRNEVQHTHCVAATRMLGFHEPPSPYIIRDHTETLEGAVLQVVMPIDRPVTVCRFSDPRQFLMSLAHTVSTEDQVHGHRDADGGCRTKVRTKVSDAEKWLSSYRSDGVHRVLFYGDHIKGIERLSRLLGFEVIREA